MLPWEWACISRINWLKKGKDLIYNLWKWKLIPSSNAWNQIIDLILNLIPNPPHSLLLARTFHFSLIEKKKAKVQKHQTFLSSSVTSKSYMIFYQYSKCYQYSKLSLKNTSSNKNCLNFACFIICSFLLKQEQ